MAYYAALVPLVQLLKDITHHDHPYSNYVLDKQQLHLSLYEKFNLLQELLEDYSHKGLPEKSADTLESRIRDVAYQTQDIIESYISNQVKPARGFKGVFRKLNYYIAEKEYYQGLEKVKGEVDSIVEELMRIKENHTTKENLQLLNSYTWSADSGGGASKVQAPIGKNSTLVLDEDLITTIKGQLCGEPSRREVISIVGMGGLGKSTLARYIFDDKLIDDHFDRCARAWITVSQDYHLRTILLAIVDSLNLENKKELMAKADEGLLEEHIYKHLKGRRYLIIIDDVWETKVWDDVRRVFPDDSNGSRVITTTRLLNVAVYADNCGFIHELRCLNEDKSWNLFRQKVLCPPDLEDIGRLIAKKCGGLPLAIVVVAGLLSKVNKIRHDWEEIARDVSSAAIHQSDNDFSKILALSYNHLPHHLKPCFLYFGGFPEDYQMSISDLIKLWVAEGFIKPISSKTLEEVGNEYFKDLVSRNLVLVTRKTIGGKILSCTIHDLLRDLCSQRARYELFLHCLDKKNDFHPETVGNVRRFSIQMWKDSSFHKYRKEHISHVRTICFLDNDSVWPPSSSVVSDFKLLRVLDTPNVRSSEYFDAIVELLHLRYLRIFEASNIHIPPSISKLQIPPSISKLQNLQTLDLGVSISSLPSEIWKMSHLRHIEGSQITLPPIPCGERITCGVPLLGRLHTLGTLHNFRFTSDTVEMIPSLKELSLTFSRFEQKGGCWEEFGLKNLVHLHQLEELDIKSWVDVHVVAPLPENFTFPPNLIKLNLYNVQLPWKDMRVVGSLPNLQELILNLFAFVGEEWQPVEGQFLKLKFLIVYGLYGLKYWRAENTHFPCLEQLRVINCLQLEEIPLEIGDISTLQLIEVHKSSPAVESSALKIQEEQRDMGNDDLQVRIIPLTYDNL